MDCKAEVVNKILAGAVGIISTEQQQRFSDLIYTALYDYDVTPKELYSELPMIVYDVNEDLLHRFLLAKAVNCLSENTLKLYKYRLERFLTDINKKVTDITADDIRYYLANEKIRTKCSNTTLSNVRMCLSSFFSWLFTEEYITKNPMLKIPNVKLDTIKEQPFSVTDAEKIRNACSTKRDRALVEFLFSTGCRVSEVVSTNRDNIDSDTKQLTVIGKGKKQRTVYLSDKALMYLKEYLEDRKDENPSLFVSINQPFNALSKDGIEAILKSIGTKADVPDVHPHRFRRTMCCNLVNRGMPIQDVSQIMGHSSISTTEIYYNSIGVNVKNKFDIISN